MTDTAEDTRSETEAHPGMMPFRVARKQRETGEITSFYLEPVQPGDWRPFRAGQHLAIALDCPGRPLATYTISSGPEQRGFYRITVKREAEGLGGSRHLHEQIEEGATLMVSPPRGRFLVEEGRGPVLLLTGGVGITPAVSMLHELAANPSRPVAFIHSAQSGEHHVLDAEVRALAARAPHVSVHIAYAAASDEEVAAGSCDVAGMLDRAALRRLLPLDAWEVYLCGPPGFMTAMRHALTDLGIPKSSIRQEIFSRQPAIHAKDAIAPKEEAPASSGPMVAFRSGAPALAWDDAAGSLLDFVEEAGFAPDFSCRAGICGTCACRLLEGEVSYDELPLEEPEPGFVLLCCSRPKGHVTLDL